MFFDLNIKGKDLDGNIELANYSQRYGWNHINFSYSTDNFKKALEFKEELQSSLNNKIAIDYTLEINNDNIRDINKNIRKYRDVCNCISVVGGNLKVNRASCENIQVDVLSRPYLGRYDSGINQVLAKEALNNNVAIELCFTDILNSYLSHRSKILANFKDIYTLHRKFNFPLILSSRAESIFDIKASRDFKAFFISTGLTSEEFDQAMESSKGILEFNKNRKNMILKGVRRIVHEA